MLASAATLGTAQLARSSTIAIPIRQEGPGRVALLEGLRRRNAVLDTLFYDVGVVEREEAAAISPWLAAEGAILAVPPSGSGRLELYRSVGDYAASGWSTSRALVVAGVGSSALGAAAFARNVADALDRPVTAVVSGYGLGDVAAEALGGFFLFGALNGFRHVFDGLDARPDAIGLPAGETSLIRRSRDTRTVFDLLSDPRFPFDFAVGHSKGNLVLSEALYAMLELRPERADALAASLTIVTISAKIAMPRPFRRVIDVMGGLDWFGALNSRLDIPTDHVVPGAWHHTNTELQAHLPVTRVVRELFVEQV